MYPNNSSTKCEKCGRGDVDVIHNYVLTRISGETVKRHILKCRNIGGGMVCVGTSGYPSDCSMGQMYVYKACTAGRGHRVTQQCSECNTTDTTYYYPHASQTSTYDSNCLACNMSGLRAEYPIRAN